MAPCVQFTCKIIIGLGNLVFKLLYQLIQQSHQESIIAGLDGEKACAQNPSPSGQLITPRETSGAPGNNEPPASLSIVHLEWIDLQVLRKPSASSGLSYEILYGKWKQRITKQKDAQVGHLSPQQITCYGNALQPAGFSAQIFCRFFGGVWPWKFNCSAYVQSLRHKLL